MKPGGEAMPSMQINVDDLPQYVCDRCGCERFIQIFRLYAIPTLMQGFTKGADIVQLQVWECAGCSETYATPKQMRAIPSAERKMRGLSNLEPA